ncbi:F-box protein SKIP24 isoform X2 [Carex littledalei]|uniref:F-box protein SKIP24 isoform X2 n=1 Tax=Carex littledalei TaxID=544730 RepID=A0A833W136_9POAL|nr:F-box protein SKIP24 isoform X2 [Carex littledalei]
MESVPGDVWHKILQIGIQEKRLDHIDLCSLAIVNNYFNQLTQDPALWAILISRDVPDTFHFVEAPSKDLYRRKLDWIRFCILEISKLMRDPRASDSGAFALILGDRRAWCRRSELMNRAVSAAAHKNLVHPNFTSGRNFNSAPSAPRYSLAPDPVHYRA